MRLWSIHPKYLDQKGLVALWREGLLARKVLVGKTKGYTNHPQLVRFRNSLEPMKAIDFYLEEIAKEGARRGYNFDDNKIVLNLSVPRITVTHDQLAHEIKHLNQKLQGRAKVFKQIDSNHIKAHPLFKPTNGRVEHWEKTTDNLHSFPYDLVFKKIDFKKNPELYRIGKGEQGVLMVEPYKSEILPFWKFKTPEIAAISAKKIYSLFLAYKKQGDFVGMDMSRKYLQMGYTRSRRYANHPYGKKYILGSKKELPQAEDWGTNEKAQSARIFYVYYQKVIKNKEYIRLKAAWLDKH